MPVSAAVVAPSEALDELTRAVDAAKEGDLLTPVAVVVPTNQSGVMARRALGRHGGVAGVDMLTLNRLAEVIAGPGLAARGRRPVSTPILDLTIRAVLAEHAGRFEPVAGHPSTVVALRDLHRELRLAEPDRVSELGATWRGREPVRISREVVRRLRRNWYDEADLLAAATSEVGHALPAALRRLVLYLPDHPDAVSLGFLRALGAAAQVRLIVASSGTPAHVESLHGWLPEFAGADVAWPEPTPPGAGVSPSRVVSTTDADDEARIAVDAVVDAARGTDGSSPVPFERIAVLWPASRPYARLVEHHLAEAGIPWNGPSGTAIAERIAPRLLLDLLDVDRRGLQRTDLFALLADVPVRDDDGRRRPVGEWERVSRAAGVSRGNWERRLERIGRRDRWQRPAGELAEFVAELQATLGDRRGTRSWSDWVGWCDEQLDSWLGPAAFRHMSDADYRAWESLVRVLERLSYLDDVGEPVTRAEFRSVLEGELDEISARQGRVGSGVTVTSLAAASGLDVDVAVVVGAAEGLLPPSPRRDPLLSEADRELAGLSSSDAWAERLHELLLATLSSTHSTVTVPRGDLRTTAERQPSRWIADWFAPDRVEFVASHVAGLRDTRFPSSERERRLRDRMRGSEAHLPLARLLGHDQVAWRGLALRRARASAVVTEFDGDLSAAAVPILDSAVSPTQIEAWVACPHAYFVNYVLRVRPIEEPESDLRITPREKGSLQHEALDRFVRDVVDERLPLPGRTGWTEEHRAALLAHGTAVCDEWEAQGRAGRPATWVGERGQVLSDLSTWLDRDSEVGLSRRAVPIASEWAFTESDAVAIQLPDGRSLALKGKIDRVDQIDTGLAVTDHKTGRADAFKKLSDDDPTLDRTHFQLAAYAAAARALAERRGLPHDAPVLAEYAMLEKGDYKRYGVTFGPDVWERVSNDLGEVVDGIESGWFPPLPPPPVYRPFTPCDYCDPDGMGTADAHERFRRKAADPRAQAWLGIEEAADG